MIGLELLRRAAPYLIGLALVALLGYSVYGFGVHVERNRWQAQWAQRDADDATARADAEQDARAKEQADQAHMNKVQTDATQRLEALQTDAAGANAAADRLRLQVGQLLATDAARRKAGTCARSPAAENPGNLLAVVLDKSIARNRELAAFADSALNAAQACRAAYVGNDR